MNVQFLWSDEKLVNYLCKNSKMNLDFITIYNTMFDISVYTDITMYITH